MTEIRCISPFEQSALRKGFRVGTSKNFVQRIEQNLQLFSGWTSA